MRVFKRDSIQTHCVSQTWPEFLGQVRLGESFIVETERFNNSNGPIQEFFFRGWLQSHLEDSLGQAAGLLAATAGFTMWHYCWPLATESLVPLSTVEGFAATFGAGLIYGYSFQRTGSILAPWIAHSVSGIALLLMGAGSFLGPLP